MHGGCIDIGLLLIKLVGDMETGQLSHLQLRSCFLWEELGRRGSSKKSWLQVPVLPPR